MNSRIYVEVPSELKQRLRKHAYAASKTQAEVVQEALEAFLRGAEERPVETRASPKTTLLSRDEARDYLAWHLQVSLSLMDKDHELREEAQECLNDLVQGVAGCISVADDFLYTWKDIDDSEDIPRWRAERAAAKASGVLSVDATPADAEGRSS